MRLLVMGAAAAAMVIATPVAGAPARHNHEHGAKAGTSGMKVDKQSMPDLGAMLALMDKMFPAQPDPDPARLALAHTAVNAMWPDGSYGKMLTGMLGGVYDRAMQMKSSDFAALDNKPPKPETKSSDLTIHDSLAAEDPYFDQRAAAIRAVLEEEAAKLSAVIDPRMRDGLSRGMARRFDEHQLADVNAFFATPSGRAFAGQYLQLWLDPDAMRSMMSATPDMMKLMPEAMQKVNAAADKFPKPAKQAAAPAKK